MKADIPNDLIAQVARQNCVVFVGAGLSAGLGLPGWSQLIRQMVDWCESHAVPLPNKDDIETLISEGKLLSAADALRAKMGDDKYYQFLREIFVRPDLKPTDVHKILSKIPFVSAATTNYDPFVEDAYREAHPGMPVSVFTQVDHEQLGTALHAKSYFVLKAHGTIERPETIVLGQKDYSRLIHRSEGYGAFLRALFIDRTVLFLGFSMTDPELRLLLEELREIFEGNTPTHYALTAVSNKTEQEQFEENFGVKVIAYTPSANDHPEVKSFLLELGERVTQQAIWYQIEEARKVADDTDPHYQAVFTTDGEFIIKERYPGASEEKPLHLSFTVGRGAHEAIQRHLATGEPLKIKGEDIIDVKVPDIISRYIKITEHLEISTGVARGKNTVTAKAIVECTDGEIASLDNIILENIQGGEEQMIISNEHQAVPWTFRQIVKFDQEESTLNFTLKDVGAPIKRALEGLRFSRVLSKGGNFYFENAETGARFAYAEFPPGAMPPPDPLLIIVLEALELIQKKTGVFFTSPRNVPRAVVENILAVETILKTGRIDIQPPVFQYTNPTEARNDIERFARGATISLMQYSDDWVFIILGKKVFLGPVLVVCEKMTIPPEGLESLKKAVENGLSADNPAQVRFTPISGTMLEAKILYWLPDEEAEEIRNLPFVKTTVLNSLIKTLFDTARQDGTFNIEEFSNLLDVALDEKSDKGTPLSPLGSATPQELILAFEPLVADLKPEEKLKLAVRLFREDWLPSGEAAGLAELDEAGFLDEVVKQTEGEKPGRPAQISDESVADNRLAHSKT